MRWFCVNCFNAVGSLGSTSGIVDRSGWGKQTRGRWYHRALLCPTRYRYPAGFSIACIRGQFSHAYANESAVTSAPTSGPSRIERIRQRGSTSLTNRVIPGTDLPAAPHGSPKKGLSEFSTIEPATLSTRNRVHRLVGQMQSPLSAVRSRAGIVAASRRKEVAGCRLIGRDSSGSARRVGRHSVGYRFDRPGLSYIVANDTAIRTLCGWCRSGRANKLTPTRSDSRSASCG